MKYTKEQAQEVLKDWFDYKETRSTTKNTYEKFIESRFPSLEVGKWYKSISGGLVFVESIQDYTFTGYGFNYLNLWQDIVDYWWTKGFTIEATHEEVKAALIKEAERRGIWQMPSNDVDGLNRLYRSFTPCYSIQDNQLWSEYGKVFKNGKWATPIVQDPTKEKLSELEDTIKKAQQEIQELKRLQK
jgi:hypothetical protein